jgi:hypothetical protein
MRIENSLFTHNAAVQGGIFNIYEGASLIVNSSTITENFAIDSGVIVAKSNGNFQFISSNITENQAFSIPLAYIFDSTK